MSQRTNLSVRGSFLLMVIWIGLSGCTTTAPEVSSSPVQKALIGKSKKDLMACALVKPEERMVGDLIVLRYYKEASILEESFSGSKSSVARFHHGCWATLGLKDDRVEGVEFKSVPSSYNHDDHCEEIFMNCQGK